MSRNRTVHDAHERSSIEGSTHLGVIVEINEDLSRRPSAMPAIDARRPPFERSTPVAAFVELRRAVQAYADEVGGHLVEVGITFGGVRNAEGNSMPPEQCKECRIVKTRVPNFEGVANGAVG